MSTATLAPPARPNDAAGRGMLLSGIRWHTYEALLRDLHDRPIRLTYDRGNLEIMAPSFNHERCNANSAAISRSFVRARMASIKSPPPASPSRRLTWQRSKRFWSIS